MAKLVDRLAYSGEPPYHGLGIAVPHRASPLKMLKAAGLDWEVARRALYFSDAPIDEKGEEVIDGSSNGGFTKIPKKNFCLVRSTDNEVMTPHFRDRYKPIQNADALDIFWDFSRKGDMQMDTVGGLDDGRIIFATAKIKQGFRLAQGEEIEGYLLLSQSHKYGEAMKVNFTPRRVIDGSTYVQGLGSEMRGAQFQMSHSKEFDQRQIEKIKHVLNITKAHMAAFKEQATTLSQTKASKETQAKFFMSVFQPTLVTDLLKAKKRLPRSPAAAAKKEEANRTLRIVPDLIENTPNIDNPALNGTLWGCVCSVMYFYDHVYGREQSTRLKLAWFGTNRKAKQKAMRNALHMAANYGQLPETK